MLFWAGGGPSLGAELGGDNLLWQSRWVECRAIRCASIPRRAACPEPCL